MRLLRRALATTLVMLLLATGVSVQPASAGVFDDLNPLGMIERELEKVLGPKHKKTTQWLIATGTATRRELIQCGVGAATAGGGMMGANVAVNVVRNSAGKRLISIYGGPYGLIAATTADCVQNAVNN